VRGSSDFAERAAHAEARWVARPGDPELRDASSEFYARRRCGGRGSVRATRAAMKQSVALITLAVADYERAKAFDDALGWTPRLDVQETAFYPGDGVVVVL
jgi:hypothetical protein